MPFAIISAYFSVISHNYIFKSNYYKLIWRMFFIYSNIYFYFSCKFPFTVVKFILTLGALFPELIIRLKLLRSSNF